MPDVSVAIPVRDGGAQLRRTLKALAAQTVKHELLVCDSGSTDGSEELARAHGARLLKIAPSRFSHGGTRNLLMQEASGAHVAFVSQDAEPADALWLERLLEGFQLARGVALVFGPYLPRPGASPAVRLELERWFRSLSPDGAPRVDRLREDERPPGRAHQKRPAGPGCGSHPSSALVPGLPASALLGRRGFFTDANGCVLREAWLHVPFREVPYAEDRVLALDMLRAGYAKVYVPSAAVLHSHEYTSLEELRRCFDEWRGLLEVYGWREPCSPAHLARRVRGELGWSRRELARNNASRAERRATLLAVARHHVVRLAGALLGSRAECLPPGTRRRLSLERRSSFEPLDIDSHAGFAVDPNPIPDRPSSLPPKEDQLPPHSSR